MSNFLKNLHPLLKRKKDRYDNEDPNYALINTLNDEMNMIETDALESKLQSSLKTSTGKYLDTFGDWFGVYRKDNEDDDKYRERIIRELLLKRGTNNAIIDAIRYHLDDKDLYVDVYEPFKNIFYTNKSLLNGEDHLMGYYYRFAVINVTIGDYFPLEIIDVINEFKPAGVQLFVTYDGAYTNSGSFVIDWLKELPKIDVYTNLDRLSGFDELFYGHINMGFRKDDVRTSGTDNIFKTNKSDLNSLDVLTGSSSVGRTFHNFAYLSNYSYTPTRTSSVTNIMQAVKGREPGLEYYLNTNVKNSKIAPLEITSSTNISYLYNNFNLREFLNKYRPFLLNNLGSNPKKEISDYLGEVTFTALASAVLPPDKSVEMDLQIYDFNVRKWITVKETMLSFDEKDVGTNLGYIQDYINDDLVFYTRFRVISKEPTVNINVNYLDLAFYHFTPSIYTIRPYKALVDNYSTFFSEKYIEAFKVSKVDNGDIISETGYQPIGYLRLIDDYAKKGLTPNLLRYNTKGVYDYSVVAGYKGKVINYKGKECIMWEEPNNIFSLTKQEGILEEGKTYTYSFYMCASEPTSLYSMYINPNNNGFIRNESIGTEWERHSFTFTSKGDNTSVTPHFYPRTKKDDGTFIKIYLADWKLEEGTKATTFSPSPYDVYKGREIGESVLTMLPEGTNRVIPTYGVPRKQQAGDGQNLLDKFKNINKSNVNQMVTSTRSYNMHTWAQRIYNEDYMDTVLIPGQTYTISYEVELIKTPDNLKMYSNQVGFALYSFGSRRSAPGATIVTVLPDTVGSKQKVTKTFTIDEQDKNRYTLLGYSQRYTVDGSAYGTPENTTSESAVVKVTNLKLENGDIATPYTSSPNDEPRYINEIIQLKGAPTDVTGVKVSTTYNYDNVNLEYARYNLNDWKPLKTGLTLSPTTTVIKNKIKDLYGLTTTLFTDITPMSEVLLSSVWNVTIGGLNDSTKTSSNLPRGFFNAVWQTVERLNEINPRYLKILRDTSNGITYNDSGDVINLAKRLINTYLTVSRYSEVKNKFTEPVLLSSSRSLNDLSEYPLTIETYDVDNNIKVKDSISDIFPTPIIHGDINQQLTLTGSTYAEYPLLEPIKEGQKYTVDVYGEFKSNLQYLFLYNSNAQFQEAYGVQSFIKDGACRFSFIGKPNIHNNGSVRQNETLRVYITPYDNEPSKIYRLEVRKV
nr:MAG TPA: Baseplate wedge protein [Herelleviridae sp.]